MDEGIKRIIEMAVAAGRKRQIDQTGYIHLSYKALPEEVNYPIPIVENVLFALSLCRTKTVEGVTEAKTLIEKLLYFQNREGTESDGNFPVYLHEYPECKDWYNSVHLIPPFYWLLAQFPQVLGQELRLKLEDAAKRILSHLLRTVEVRGGPEGIRFMVAAGALAFGKLFNDQHFRSFGEEALKEFMFMSPLWFQPRFLGEMLAGLQMIEADFTSIAWQPFWEHLNTVWHSQIGAYVGPAFYDLQKGEEPAAFLYDLYMGFITRCYSKHALKDSETHLYAALIQPFTHSLPPKEFPFVCQGELKGQAWSLRQSAHFAVALIEQVELFNPMLHKGFCPLRIVWGTPERIHTLVSQGGNSRRMDFKEKEGVIELDFTLDEDLEPEDREKNRDLTFFCDLQDGIKYAVNGMPATTFKLDDCVKVLTPGLNFELKFAAEEVEGQFLGHIMRGNRPSQVSVKGVNRFAAFDWQIFLRALRRSGKSNIRVKLCYGV